jgi:hypothetical protein
VALAGEELARAFLDAVCRGQDVAELARALALERLPELSLEARDVITILAGEPTAVAAAVRLSAASLAQSNEQETS